MGRHLHVLIVHNYYQHRGGEDSVVEAEVLLLRNSGCEVETLFRHNYDIQCLSPIRAGMGAFWSHRTRKEAMSVIMRFRPDVIHVHNTLPLVSPSIYWAASRWHIPVVQTLHNFRWICPQAMFLRNGFVCEDCLGRLPWRGVSRKCYRSSFLQSAVLAGLLIFHRVLGTWQRKVTRCIALTEFSRNKFVEGGLPFGRIAIKPNFADIPSPPPTPNPRVGGIFVGRLSPEKGVAVLLNALNSLNGHPVVFIGSGPEQDKVSDHPHTRFVGEGNQDEVINRMRSASYLLVPSICYENFPRTIVEAFACGLPVIASRLGAMAELVRDGETGLLFEPGNTDELAQTMAWADTHPEEMREMGFRARMEYETKYSPEINAGQLLAIYDEAIAQQKSGERPRR